MIKSNLPRINRTFFSG